MKISSWNVNSVRARIENIKDYLNKFSPNILLMQEIKTEEKNFPFNEFEDLGYHSYVFGQKSYNGVAIISKKKLENVSTDIIKDKLKQARTISAEFEFKKRNLDYTITALHVTSALVSKEDSEPTQNEIIERYNKIKWLVKM